MNGSGSSPLGRRVASLLPVLLALLLAAAGRAEGIRSDATLEFLDLDGQPFLRMSVELATTPETWARGLMHRTLPDDQSGLLFVYPEAAPRAFWMRNTPESLDMLFADGERRLIHIARDTPPWSDQIHSSQGDARYVLETRAGFAARHGLTPGVRFDYYPSPRRMPGME